MYSGQHSGVPHCGSGLRTLAGLTSDLGLASSVALINHMATSGGFLGRDGSLSGDASCGNGGIVERRVCLCVQQISVKIASGLSVCIPLQDNGLL